MAAMWVAKTYYFYYRMFVIFSWNAKYYYLLMSFIVFFIKLMSSFTFFLFPYFFPISSYSISIYYAMSFYFLPLSLFFWTIFYDFLTDVDLTGFLGSYFLAYYYFLLFTPELLSEPGILGGALFAGITGFWAWGWLVGADIFGFYYFLIFLAEFIFWMCYFEKLGFFYSL